MSLSDKILLLSYVGLVTGYPIVTLPGGVLVGSYVSTREGRPVASFLGIPFAKSPVGSRRFQIHAKALLPVFIYIFGGFFEVGSASGYTHEYLLDEGVVYVAIQYRLGLFGFFSTGDELVPGNMWLKDQRLAFRWVKENIRFFGGDPDKVTIGGESAGGVSVHYHLTFGSNEGLFRAGIIQSATALDPWAFRPNNELKRMNKVLSILTGCPFDLTSLVDCLRKRPALELVFLYSVFYKIAMYPEVEISSSLLSPMIGGVIEPECVEDKIITDNPWHYNISVPTLMGVDSMEALIALTTYLNDWTNKGFVWLNEHFNNVLWTVMNYPSSSANESNIGEITRNFYLKNMSLSRDTFRQLTDLLSDAQFVFGTYEAARRSNPNNTYYYRFGYVGSNSLDPIPPQYHVGAAHSDELWYQFPRPSGALRLFDSKSDTIMSKNIVKMWMNFVKYLDPTPGDTFKVKWTPFTQNSSYLNITQHNMEMKTSFLKERMQLWQNTPFPVRDDQYDPIPCRRKDDSIKDDSFFTNSKMKFLLALKNEYLTLYQNPFFKIGDVDKYKKHIQSILKKNT